MCYEEITCPRCSALNITKNGITANRKQRYRCKECGRQFITHYTYQACDPKRRNLIIPMTLNASGIRDIARVLTISPNTVLRVIKMHAATITEPSPRGHVKDLELDEFWSFVQQKSDQRWTWLAWDRHCKQVVAFVNGRRTDANCRLLYRKLSAVEVNRFHSDKWEAYQKSLPHHKHDIGKQGTRNIERRNLTFRTRIKRLQRRTICFSKSNEMHDAVIKLHIHYSNLQHHQI